MDLIKLNCHALYSIDIIIKTIDGSLTEKKPEPVNRELGAVIQLHGEHHRYEYDER